MTFAKLGLAPGLLRAVEACGFQAPTSIQADAIGPALEGRDVLGCAATGSGKTAAFLLPILQHLLEAPGRGTRALVLAPTRELAAQILDEARRFSRGTSLRSAVVVGGVGMRPQEEALRSGVDVLVATPGRLLDHLRMPGIHLDQVRHLVLDEADRMLDMGFLPDVRRILARIPKQRQTMFFSATVPPEIARLAGEMLKDPVRIGSERKAAPAASVTQHVYPVHSTRKAALLAALLEAGVVDEAIVFTRTKHRADRLARVLVREGVKADRIHGDRSQNQRTAALSGFKAGKLRVLVATDIAARGIDVAALGHVVNYDVPACPEDYVHRVGRTGRASETGEAITFVTPEDEPELRRIEKALGTAAIRREVLEGFDYTPEEPKAGAATPRPARGSAPAPGRARPAGGSNPRSGAGSRSSARGRR